MKHLLIPIFALIINSLTAQTIRYVDHNATGASDGSSWTNAFTRFQQALAIAQDGDEIWIAKGVYKPSASNDRFAFYDLPSGVQVFGGFAGTETQRDQRDWTANPTILSGDIGVPGDSTDNSFNILYALSPNEKTRLDGLIFEEGNANNTDNNIDGRRPTRSGAGIYLDGEGFGYAQLSVSNCIFRHNRAQFQGGGIYANGLNAGVAIVYVDHCLFENNYSATYGAALSIDNHYEQPFDVAISNSTFKKNFSINSGSAIWLQCHQAVRIFNCNFLQNNSLGTVIHFRANTIQRGVEIENCLFEANRDGSSVLFFEMYELIQDGLQTSISNSRFLGNSAHPLGFITFNTLTQFQATNCIFAQNKNGGGSASVLGWEPGDMSSQASFTNCLLYKNEGVEFHAFDAKGAPIFLNNSIVISDNSSSNQLYVQALAITTPTHLNNCLFSQPSCASLGLNILCENGNQFGLDPLFLNPAISDFHLQPCSPAINAGMNAILDSLGITTDLDGNPRIRNGVVDMGPYEQHISLNPSVLAQPACAGASDGSVGFDAEICPPFTFAWSNGVTTGNNTDGLAAGTYVFTAIGSNNVPVTDTILISEPMPLEVVAVGHDANCAGASNGWIEASASGGTAPYQYYWEPPIPPVPSNYNLPAGAYFLTVTDTNGCTGTTQATIGSPDPIEVFYTIYNTSCLGCSDGSVVFDSITGGVNPVLPPPMVNLPVGHYCFTITDAVACQAVVCFNILATSGTPETALESLVKLHPNPTATGETALLEWSGQENAMVRILDLQGRLLEQQAIAANTSIRLTSHWLSGIYLVEIRTNSGKSTRRIWSVF